MSIYGEIGEDFWGESISAKALIKELKGIPNDAVVNFHVNSVGGSVWDGIAIYNAIKDMPNKKTVFVEGLAASIASIIALAGDAIHMCIGSMMMIHNAWTFAAGDANSLEEEAERLRKVNESLIDIYEKETNLNRDEIAEYMNAETWLSAEEAVELGFATTMDEVSAVASVRDGKFVINGITFNESSLKGFPIDRYTETEGKEAEVMDLETFKAEYPDMYNEIVTQAATAERERLKALDTINCAGASEIVNRAKYETLQEANEVALEILNSVQESMKKTEDKLAEMQSDAGVVNAVEAGQNVPTQQVTAKAQTMRAMLDMIGKEFSK